MKKFLVTGCNGDIGASIVRNLSEEYEGCKIIGTDISTYTQSIPYLDRFIQIVPYSHDSYIESLFAICKKHEISYLIPSHEGEIMRISKDRTIFEEAGIFVLIIKNEFLDIFTSKNKTGVFLETIQISVPKIFEDVSSVTEANLPVIMKPDEGCGSRNIKIIRTKEELDSIKTVEHVAIQQYVGTEDSEYTVALFMDKGAYSYVAFKRRLGLGGLSILVETIEFPWLDDVCKRLVEKLNMTGCINFQFRMENDQYYVFEINPRISSTVRFRHKMGFKDLIWWIQALEHKENQFVKIPEGTVGVKTCGEIIYTKEALEKCEFL